MEQRMGKQKVEDKTISPAEFIKALQSGSITIAQAQQMFNGTMPVGDYKGIAAIFDLDKLVNQPLVDIEQKYMLGILSGRQAGYDLVTVTTPITATAPSVLSGALTVPDDDLWYVNAVRMTGPGGIGGGGVTLNWHCSLWTDLVAASPLGQPFHDPTAALANAAGLTTHTPPLGGPNVQLDEFGATANIWLPSNKVPLLRLPAGTVITFTVSLDTGSPLAPMVSTLQLYGSLGKILVS